MYNQRSRTYNDRKKNLIYKENNGTILTTFSHFVAYKKKYSQKNVPIVCQRLSVTPVKLFGFYIKISKISQRWITRLCTFTLHRISSYMYSGPNSLHQWDSRIHGCGPNITKDLILRRMDGK